MALTLLNTPSRFTYATNPPAQTHLRRPRLCQMPKFSTPPSSLPPAPCPPPPSRSRRPPHPRTCSTGSNSNPSWEPQGGGGGILILLSTHCPCARSFAVTLLGMFYQMQLDYSGTTSGWAWGGARTVDTCFCSFPALLSFPPSSAPHPCIRAQHPLLLGCWGSEVMDLQEL